MTLTKSDFKKYSVNEILARRDEKFVGGLSAFSYLRVCGEESRRYEEAGDDSGAELFGVLRTVSSLWLEEGKQDPKQPFAPLWTNLIPCKRSCLSEVFSEANLNFLAEIVCDVEEAVLRAQIADVLWIRKYGERGGYDSAVLAFNSYLESVRLNSPDLYTPDRIRRALQIAKLLNDPEGRETALGVARDLADVLAETDEFFLWIRIVELLVTHGKDRDEHNAYAERIWQRASEFEQGKGLDFAVRCMEGAVDLFDKCGNQDRVKEVKLELVEKLIRQAEQEAENGDYRLAELSIEQAIKLLPQTKETAQRREDLHVRHAGYGKEADLNMEWKAIRVEPSQEEKDVFETLSESVKDDLKGKLLEEALFYLAEIPYPISADAMKAKAERSQRESLAAQTASIRVRNHTGKIVSRDWPFSASWFAEKQRKTHVDAYILPAIEQINREHNVELEGLQIILGRSLFVPPHLRRTFAYALLKGFKYDFVAMAHILPSMLEGAFRGLLTAMGINTSNSNDELVSEERPLGWILYHSRMNKVLGPDLSFDLRTLLLEPKREGGFNLRNGTSHGLMTDGYFFPAKGGMNSRELAQILYLWWIVLRFCISSQGKNARDKLV